RDWRTGSTCAVPPTWYIPHSLNWPRCALGFVGRKQSSGCGSSAPESMILREARFRVHAKGDIMRRARLATIVGTLLVTANVVAQTGDATVRMPAAEIRGGNRSI